MLYENLKQF